MSKFSHYKQFFSAGTMKKRLSSMQMNTKTKLPVKNDLRQIRKRCGLDRKQIALLLSHKWTSEISKYEQGVHLPNLETALQLEAIYHMPIKLMFPSLFERIKKDIAQKKEQHPQLFPDKNWFPKNAEQLEAEEFCFYANILKSRIPNAPELQVVNKHVINLVKICSDYKNDRHPFSQN